jgi:hypothetical protein
VGPPNEQGGSLFNQNAVNHGHSLNAAELGGKLASCIIDPPLALSTRGPTGRITRLTGFEPPWSLIRQLIWSLLHASKHGLLRQF